VRCPDTWQHMLNALGSTEAWKHAITGGSTVANTLTACGSLSGQAGVLLLLPLLPYRCLRRPQASLLHAAESALLSPYVMSITAAITHANCWWVVICRPSSAFRTTQLSAITPAGQKSTVGSLALDHLYLCQANITVDIVSRPGPLISVCRNLFTLCMMFKGVG
jgi:hypothetical protein